MCGVGMNTVVDTDWQTVLEEEGNGALAAGVSRYIQQTSRADCL